MNLEINDIDLHFSSQEWKDFITKRINRTEGLTICEVGVGEYSKCHTKSFIGTENTLILVEALPMFNREIQGRVKNEKNVIHHQLAVADTVGVIEFNAFDIESHIKGVESVAQARRRDCSTIEIPCTTFNTLDPGNIDVLFIDIEGAEYFVLKHLISRPKILRIEINIPGFTNSFEAEIATWLSENGYKQTDIIGSDIIYIRSTND